MPVPLLICDDSTFAQKQMSRSLPVDWGVEITFASNGLEAIEALKQGKGEIMFLDLNMPEMDGYQVLQAIREQDISTMVIVVSGDIQPEARKRVMQLGALDFIKKPIDQDALISILDNYGIRRESSPSSKREELKLDYLDACKEVVNVAMGRAADLLARLLNVFVILPIPVVNRIEVSELRMALHEVQDKETVSAVCQAFIGSGIAGEALLIFDESSFVDIAELMSFKGELNDSAQMELLMDISSILIGACLKGIANQLDITFSQRNPAILGRHVMINDILKKNASGWNEILAIEVPYRIENKQIACDLLLLFTEDSIDALKKRISYLSE
ncbi:MAG: response regulator [Gammaproteobacteria bacterium]|nr:response regulator [Gammaproteobacteria bacterium]